MRLAAPLIAVLLLGSCAFGSEGPLFGADDAVFPIPDGAVYTWRAYPEDETLQVRFRRTRTGYDAIPLNRPNERPMRIVFASIMPTHDDDYIAQVDIHGDGEGFAYAFLWPWGDDRYRVIVDPRAFDENGENAAPDLCEPGSMGACAFSSAEDAREYFMRVLYPRLRAFEAPREFLDIGPVDGDLPPLPAEAPPDKPTR